MAGLGIKAVAAQEGSPVLEAGRGGWSGAGRESWDCQGSRHSKGLFGVCLCVGLSGTQLMYE